MGTKTKVKITDRSVWIKRMKDAGKSRKLCLDGFLQACGELAEVAAVSKEFDARTKKAAAALDLVANIENGFTDTIKSEFMRQYKILGAPGDFGYDINEGRAMQAVYEWWTVLGQATEE